MALLLNGSFSIWVYRDERSSAISCIWDKPQCECPLNPMRKFEQDEDSFHVFMTNHARITNRDILHSPLLT